METENTPIDLLIKKTENLCKTSVELYKLKAIGSLADISSSILSNLVVLVLIWTGILFVSLGVSMWLGELIGNTYCGFFLVSLFYVLTGLLCYLFKIIWIKAPMHKSIIKQIIQ